MCIYSYEIRYIIYVNQVLLWINHIKIYKNVSYLEEYHNIFQYKNDEDFKSEKFTSNSI